MDSYFFEEFNIDEGKEEFCNEKIINTERSDAPLSAVFLSLLCVFARSLSFEKCDDQ